MAWTVTKDAEVVGNMRMIVATVTADAAEANLSLGLGYVKHASFGIISCSTGTALPHVALNLNSSGTASNGSIGVSGVTSGDVFCIVAYGR